jgi:hypothetical protein
MSTVKTSAAAKKTSKKAVKKISKKMSKTTKPVKTLKEKKPAVTEGKDRRMADMPVSERRVKFLSCLQKKGADGPGTAISGSDLAKMLEFTEYDVYVLGYRTSPLVKNGLVKTAVIEGVRGLSYYLTAKGMKVD